ncbi:MAG: DUF4412 domain-containing protein [Flavobacteriales bacterium]|nr:DUF4412 domain-containing protein [Flavobacteriales bacterium]
MKAILHTLFSICLVFLLSLNAESQVVDRSKESAKNKTNNRIDQKVDQGIDKSLDAIEGLFKKKDKSNKKNDDSDSSDSNEKAYSDETSDGFGGFFSKVDMEESYSFDHMVKMDMTITDKKETQTVRSTMFVNDENGEFAMKTKMEDVNSTMIFDVARNQMIILTDMEGQKLAMSMDYDPAAYATAEEDDESYDMGEFKKTGRTKTILGYTCHEYVFESEESSGNCWVNEEDDLQIYKGLMAMSSQDKKKQENALPEGYPQGMIMEMDVVDEDGNETHMEVVEIKRDMNHTISTEGYGAFSLPTEE